LRIPNALQARADIQDLNQKRRGRAVCAYLAHVCGQQPTEGGDYPKLIAHGKGSVIVLTP